MSHKDGKYSQWVGGANPYLTTAPVVWSAGGRSGVVPAGFAHDGGTTSVARHLGFPSVGDELERGFLVHDHCYRVPSAHPGLKRRQADKIMRKIHKQDGVYWARRMAAWWFVRRFGKSAWKKQRQYIDAYKGMH